ncbi:MAG: hypothetical protein LBS31_07290 [Candidatus Adiutrix sp.]|jgi:hypothetical protein|nr:hypothetical protein [Candidatus Adiutrix sp.]
MIVNFQYAPPSGPLSGRSFERQTEIGFNELGQRIELIRAEAASALNMAQAAQAAAAYAEQTAAQAVALADAAQTRAQAAQNAAATALATAEGAASRAEAAYDLAAQADTAAGAAGNAAAAAVSAASSAQAAAGAAQSAAQSAAATAQSALAAAQSLANAVSVEPAPDTLAQRDEGGRVKTAPPAAGDDSVNQALLNFTTNETWTGGYGIDGKKIYRKVVALGLLPNNGQKIVPAGLTDLEAVIRLYGWAAIPGQDEMLPLPYVGALSDSVKLAYQDGSVLLQTWGSSTSVREGQAVVEFTKTAE